VEDDEPRADLRRDDLSLNEDEVEGVELLNPNGVVFLKPNGVELLKPKGVELLKDVRDEGVAIWERGENDGKCDKV
jgi:hypothetical protein